MRAVEAAGRTLGFRIDARRYFYESLAQLAIQHFESQAAPTAASAQQADRPGGLFKRVLSAIGRKAPR